MIWKVAKHIIESYHKDNLKITNLRLQKILYFIQKRVANELGLDAVPFKEDMVAWIFGPVFLDVYNRYSSYGRDNISNVLYSDNDDSINQDILEEIMEIVENEINRTKNILNDWDLVRESVRKGGPWSKATDNGANVKSQIISKNYLICN